MHPATVVERAKELSDEPGVYRFLDRDGRVLYVGKAASLRDRVGQYATDGQGPRKADMVRATVTIDVFATGTEREALILENTLIKRHRPPYNVMLTDDKTYPFLALTREPVPRIFKTRDRDAPGADVFGPFPSEGAVKHLLRAIREGFGIRDCRQMLPQGCIKHELGLCMAPCMRPVADEYAASVDATRRLLKGDAGPALAVLRRRMDEAARAEDYESAAAWRDRIASIQDVLENQAVFSNARRDRDAVSISERGPFTFACIVQERQGRVVGKVLHRMHGGLDDSAEAARRVVATHYGTAMPPREVVMEHDVDDAAALSELLASRRGGPVRLHVPRRGALVQLVALARRNAELACREALVARGGTSDRAGGLDDLRARLGLERPPERIECVDVSHLAGREVVASVVTLLDGRPAPRLYRHYKVSREANDDVAAMREVVTRRVTRLLKEDAGLPDLLLVDGGPAQVAAARAALATLTVDVPLVGLAKRLEEVYRPGFRAPLRIPRDAPGLLVLQRARDEAHRFAVRYGRTLRRSEAVRSPIDDVPGVGPVIRARLLARFGGLEGVEAASEAELAEVRGVTPVLARRIRAVVGREAG